MLIKDDLAKVMNQTGQKHLFRRVVFNLFCKYF